MADIDIAKIKSILAAAEKARGPDPRLIPPGRRESSADQSEIAKLLTPVLEKAGLDLGALEKILNQDKPHAPRKPTADAVKRHAWMKQNVVKNMRALAGARRDAAPAPAPAVVPLNPPPVTEVIQPFFIWATPIGILMASNLAADDNWARVRLETRADYGGDYVSFWYIWTNPNDFSVGIDIDTSLAFIGYCSVRTGRAYFRTNISNAHILALMNIYQMGDQDETFGPATLQTPAIHVLDLHAESDFFGSRDFNSAPVDTIVDLSNDQVAVSAGATVVCELFASFVFDNINDGVAFFDFADEYQVSNPGMTITSTPVILF